jgi:large subunit ribosomal protein L28
MPRVCEFTGRRTGVGNMYTRRGKAKYLGGVGVKVTGKTKRKFRPNIHTLTAVVEGSIRRVKASTKAIRMGLVIKPLMRKYVYRKKVEEAAAAAAGTEATGATAATTAEGAAPAAGQNPA